MSRYINIVLLLFILSCSERTELEVVDYSVGLCDKQKSIEELSKLRNRITDYAQIGDTTSIQVFFIENCGFIIDPKVTFNDTILLIEADQFFEDSTRMELLCTCCHTFQMKMLGIKGNELDKLSYFLKLSDTHPERIFLTNSSYHTYQIDYLVIESDTIYYPKVDNIYTKRVYESESSYDYTYSYFPDDGHLYLNKVNYKTGDRLRIHNDFYSLTDTLSQLIERGKVDYLILGNGEGVKVVFSKIY